MVSTFSEGIQAPVRYIYKLRARPRYREGEVQIQAATPFPRITRDPRVMGGKPCIRGMRVTVGMILGNLGDGVATDELLAAYPYLEREDVLEAMRFGAWLAQERDVTLVPAA